MRLLLVEDEIKIADSIKKGLEQERFAVDVANEGELGLNLGLSNEYDLLILDLMLPNIDGLTITKKLRSKGVNTPILVLTAKGELEDKVLGLTLGADDYLTKPFNFTELLARIKALLRRPNGFLPNQLVCDDLTIDIHNYLVTRAGKEIKLSRKEFTLLEYLMRNKNQILSKDKIIEHVWNFDSDVLPNTVEVYIGYLRNKIDKPFKGQVNLLKTIRGFGYKLEEKGSNV